MSIEAMKRARDALGLYARTLAPTETQKKGMEAITALDEASAQPQPEPVAWMHEWEDGEKIPMLKGRDDRNQDKPKTVRPLVYGDTSPQPAQPQQEPVAWANPNDLQNFDMKVRTNAGPLHTVPLYTSPQARKPLTDEEIKQFASKHLDVGDGSYATHFVTGDVAFARAIEAAHGIKGEA